MLKVLDSTITYNDTDLTEHIQRLQRIKQDFKILDLTDNHSREDIETSLSILIVKLGRGFDNTILAPLDCIVKLLGTITNMTIEESIEIVEVMQQFILLMEDRMVFGLNDHSKHAVDSVKVKCLLKKIIDIISRNNTVIYELNSKSIDKCMACTHSIFVMSNMFFEFFELHDMAMITDLAQGIANEHLVNNIDTVGKEFCNLLVTLDVVEKIFCNMFVSLNTVVKVNNAVLSKMIV